MDNFTRTEDLVTVQARKQLEACLKFKQSRVKDWQKNEDLYLGKTKPALSGRFNVPLPIMSGFIDTALAEMKENPIITFSHTKDSDILKAKKVTGAWERDSNSQNANWPRKNNNGKKIALLYGFAAYKVYATSDPKYKSHLDLIDPYDFIFEPLGGSNLEDHNGVGQDNIFKSKFQLSGKYYNQEQVNKLVNSTSDTTKSKNDIQHRNKINRFTALNLDGNFTDINGDDTYRLAEMVTVYKGERWYVLFDPTTDIWVRAVKLSDMYKSKLFPYVAYHTNEDAFNFLSVSPADNLRPACESMAILFNQALENRQKLNWGQRAYDSSVFTDPSQLEWRPSGLVEAKARENGVSIRDGIYEFSTPEIKGSIDLMAFVDNFVGQKVGITASAQGASNVDQKASVYFGDMKQVAKRISLQSDSYKEMLEQMALRYSWCLWEHVDDKMAVKILGEKGVSWEKIVKEDCEPDFDIKVTGGLQEAQMSELEKKRRGDVVMGLLANPATAQTLKPHWASQQVLLSGGFDMEEIRIGLVESTEVFNENDINNASQAIEDILKKKKPRIYNSAGMAFLKKIMDFVDNNELEIPELNAINDYFTRMSVVVGKNMASKAREMGNMMAIKEVMGQSEGGGPGIGNTAGMTAPPGYNPLNAPENQTPPTPEMASGVGVNKSVYGG